MAGRDVWVKLPRPPVEASGTSSLEAGLNGTSTCVCWTTGGQVRGWSGVDRAATRQPGVERPPSWRMAKGARQWCWPPFAWAGGPVGWSALPWSFFGGPVRCAAVAWVGALEEAALDGGADDELLDEDELLLDGDDEELDGTLELDDDDELDGTLELDDDELDGTLELEDDDELDELGVVVELVDVVGGVSQPVTQKTLCFTSAPWAPSALMVSLTWNPWMGCGSMPVKSSVYVADASRPASDPPPRLWSSPMGTLSVRRTLLGPVGGCDSNVTLADRSPWSKP